MERKYQRIILFCVECLAADFGNVLATCRETTIPALARACRLPSVPAETLGSEAAKDPDASIYTRLDYGTHRFSG